MSRDVAGLVDQLTDRGEGGALGGSRPLVDGGGGTTPAPLGAGHRRPERGAWPRPPRSDGELVGVLPCGSALGATWDTWLVERIGGSSARRPARRQPRAVGADGEPAPVTTRRANFESYPEDPLLARQAAAAFVRGAQFRGVITTVKHFARQRSRARSEDVNSVVGERTLASSTWCRSSWRSRGWRARHDDGLQPSQRRLLADSAYLAPDRRAPCPSGASRAS